MKLEHHGPHWPHVDVAAFRAALGLARDGKGLQRATRLAAARRGRGWSRGRGGPDRPGWWVSMDSRLGLALLDGDSPVRTLWVDLDEDGALQWSWWRVVGGDDDRAEYEGAVDLGEGWFALPDTPPQWAYLSNTDGFSVRRRVSPVVGDIQAVWTSGPCAPMGAVTQALLVPPMTPQQRGRRGAS